MTPAARTKKSPKLRPAPERGEVGGSKPPGGCHQRQASVSTRPLPNPPFRGREIRRHCKGANNAASQTRRPFDADHARHRTDRGLFHQKCGATIRRPIGGDRCLTVRTVPIPRKRRGRYWRRNDLLRGRDHFVTRLSRGVASSGRVEARSRCCRTPSIRNEYPRPKK